MGRLEGVEWKVEEDQNKPECGWLKAIRDYWNLRKAWLQIEKNYQTTFAILCIDSFVANLNHFEIKVWLLFVNSKGNKDGYDIKQKWRISGHDGFSKGIDEKRKGEERAKESLSVCTVHWPKAEFFNTHWHLGLEFPV